MRVHISLNENGFVNSPTLPISLGKVGEDKVTVLQINIPVVTDAYNLASDILRVNFILPSVTFTYNVISLLRVKNGQNIYLYEIESPLLTTAGNGIMSFMVSSIDSVLLWKSESVPVFIENAIS